MSQYASDDPERAAAELGLGPTGEFPSGQYNDEDIGELNIGVAADKKRGVVVVNFGASVKWIGLDGAGVDQLVAFLQEARAELP